MHIMSDRSWVLLMYIQDVVLLDWGLALCVFSSGSYVGPALRREAWYQCRLLS